MGGGGRPLGASPDAPTLPLLSQREWRSVDPIGGQWLGAVITYQSLFASTEMFLAHATDPGHRTLVIFDEIHHAGVGLGVGYSPRRSVRGRSRGDLVPERHAVPDGPRRRSCSSLRRAAQPGRITGTPTIRQSATGHAARTVRGGPRPGPFRTEDGQEHLTAFDDTLTRIGERRRLRAALEWVGPGSIAGKMLTDADRFLIGLRRQGDTDAAGLVVCVDCGHADAIARYMSRARDQDPGRWWHARGCIDIERR